MNSIRTFREVEEIYDKYSTFYDLCAAAGRGDIAAYLELSQGCELILDVGCGTGRVTRELVQAFKSVVALDVSAQMVAVCTEKLKGVGPGDVKTMQHDFCKSSLPLAADLAIVSWFTFNYLLSVKAQRLTLHNIGRSLRIGGVIVLDLFYPKCWAQNADVWEERDRMIHPDPLLVRSDRRKMEGVLEERLQSYVYGGESFTFESVRRYVSPDELAQVLTSSGFKPLWLSFDLGRTRSRYPWSGIPCGAYMLTAEYTG